MPVRTFRQAAVLAMLVLASLLGSLLTPGWSAPRPPDLALSWLRAAASAPRQVSYAGTKTIALWGGRVEASQVRIYHRAPNATRLEYLAAGAQPHRIVIINGGRTIEYIPAQNRLVSRSAPAADEERLTQALLPHLRANYNLGIGTADQVAGRRTLVVDVKSKLPGRPSLRIWVDEEKALILRFERYGPDGTLQESSAFLKVQFDPVFPPGLFTAPAPPGTQVEQHHAPNNMSLAEIAQRVGFSPRMPAYLPPGFQLTRSRVVQIHGQPAAVFAYSDGVSTLALFESRGAQGPPPRGRQVQIGSVAGTIAPQRTGTLVHWNAGGISYTLVGELPRDDLVRIAASVPAATSRIAPLERAARGWLAALVPLAVPTPAEAASPSRTWPGVPPVPVSPYITTDTRPIGPGLRDEEVRIWRAYQAAGLSPFVVKVTVASDGVTHMPNGLIGHLAWIWFVYGMDWTGGAGPLLREVQASERALAVTAFRAEPRVVQVLLTGQYQVSGPFEGRRTDVSVTARLYRERLLAQPPGIEPWAALARAGDVWYGPALLAALPVMLHPRAHEVRLPSGLPRPMPAVPGDRTSESTEHFAGSVADRILETKYRLEGILFGIETHGRFWRGNPRRREIALTFDDGPSPIATPLLLAILRRYGAHATFFVIGDHTLSYPYLVKQMIAEGHEVGNHTFHHPNLTTLDEGIVRQELAAATRAIRATVGPPRWFRPPGGDYTAQVAQTAGGAGMGLAMWTANSGDWALPPPNVVTERVLARAEPGAIILLHNGTLNTVRALPVIITELKRRGYGLVTVSQLARDAH